VLAPEALEQLMAYDFPGNVRELENILERALALSSGEQIEAEDLQLRQAARGTGGAVPVELEQHIEHVERQAIQKALEQTRFNKTAAARLLGISFRALRYRMEKLGLE
jgi:two-component system response regulator PilR (NtrC family)